MYKGLVSMKGRPPVKFCHICKKAGHTKFDHRETYENTHGPSEGFTGKAFHGNVEGSIWHGDLRRKK